MPGGATRQMVGKKSERGQLKVEAGKYKNKNLSRNFTVLLENIHIGENGRNLPGYYWEEEKMFSSTG